MPEAEHATIEFHFQEIFSGETIEILAGGAVLAEVVARTRFQLGLAHIEKLELADGEEVTLRIRESGLEKSVEIDVARPFVRVRLLDGVLHVDSVATSPGYV